MMTPAIIDPLDEALRRMEFYDGAFHIDGLRFADDEDFTDEHARVAAEVGIIIGGGPP